MTSESAVKLIPPDPSRVMVIRDVTPTVTTLSVPFLRFGRFKIGGRGTIVKLDSGSLAVFSPVALTPEVKSKVASMGRMKYIVALDIEHHIFLTPWSKEYPEAELIGVEGLPEKREKDAATKGLNFAHIFTPKNKASMKISPEFDSEFNYEYVHAHENKELVFVHKPTGTLIQADLLFNLPANEQFSKTGESPTTGLWTKLFSSFQNTHGDMIWQKRFVWYVSGARDRAAFAQSMTKIYSWNFDRIIPCHGDVIETGGKAVMEKFTEWYRKLEK